MGVGGIVPAPTLLLCPQWMKETINVVKETCQPHYVLGEINSNTCPVGIAPDGVQALTLIGNVPRVLPITFLAEPAPHVTNVGPFAQMVLVEAMAR